MPPGDKILYFTAGGRRFALPVAAISEIREAGEVTSVPGAPGVIAGLIDMRGRVLTLMDLAAIFGFESDPAAGRLAVQLAEPLEHLALLVPAAVQELRTETVAGAPETDAAAGEDASGTDGADGRPTLGREIVLPDGAPALLLDIHALAAHCTRRVRERFRVAV